MSLSDTSSSIMYNPIMTTHSLQKKTSNSRPIQPDRLAEAFLTRTTGLASEKDNESITQIRSARLLRSQLRELEAGSVAQAVMRYAKIRGEPLEVTETKGQEKLELNHSYNNNPKYNRTYKYEYKLILTEDGFRIFTTASSGYTNLSFLMQDYTEAEPLEKVMLNRKGEIECEPGIAKKLLSKIRLVPTGKAIRIAPLICLQKEGLTIEKVQEFLTQTLLKASTALKVEAPAWIPSVKSD